MGTSEHVGAEHATLRSPVKGTSEHVGAEHATLRSPVKGTSEHVGAEHATLRSPVWMHPSAETHMKQIVTCCYVCRTDPMTMLSRSVESRPTQQSRK
jgi:hypothetical protein